MRPIFFGVSICVHKIFMIIHATKTDNPFIYLYTMKKPTNNQMKSNTVPKVGSIEKLNQFLYFLCHLGAKNENKLGQIPYFV